jgi:hypothetical protein
MIYLIRSHGKGDSSLLKIGYTSSLKERNYSYIEHNPLLEIIDTREGDEELELTLQLRFSYYKADILKEWFTEESEILKHFKDSLDDIDMWLWIHREDVFKENTRSQKIKNIFKRIYNKYAPIDDPMYEGSDLEDKLLK